MHSLAWPKRVEERDGKGLTLAISVTNLRRKSSATSLHGIGSQRVAGTNPPAVRKAHALKVGPVEVSAFLLLPGALLGICLLFNVSIAAGHFLRSESHQLIPNLCVVNIPALLPALPALEAPGFWQACKKTHKKLRASVPHG